MATIDRVLVLFCSKSFRLAQMGLADLPLAIKQTSVYKAKTSISTSKYLDVYQSGTKDSCVRLSRDFEDEAAIRASKT